LALASGLLVTARVNSPLLRPLNQLWFKFGLLVSRLTTPIVMGLLFFAVVVPTRHCHASVAQGSVVPHV